MHTVFALLCFVVVIHWLIFPYPSGLLHWHWGNLTIAPVPAKQPWWIWINTSCEFIMDDCITTTKQSTTKPCAYFLGYTVLYSYFKWLALYADILLCYLVRVFSGNEMKAYSDLGGWVVLFELQICKSRFNTLYTQYIITGPTQKIVLTRELAIYLYTTYIQAHFFFKIPHSGKRTYYSAFASI